MPPESSLRSRVISTTLPNTSSELPDELMHPSTVDELTTKINLLLKPHVNKHGTPINEIGQTLMALKQACRFVSKGDRTELANVEYYDRLLAQIICGTRTFNTLTSAINGVPGLNSETVGRMIGAPPPPVSTQAYAPAPRKLRAY